MNRFPSRAECARIAAGHSIESAARKLRFSPAYVRRVELHGGGSDVYCTRAGRLFRCEAEIFFLPPRYFEAGAAGVPFVSSLAATPAAATGADTQSTLCPVRASRRQRRTTQFSKERR